MRVATDVGGSFTDLVYFDQETGRSGAVKVDTTPPDFERRVIEGLRRSGLDPSEIELFAHGTTLGINALTERKVAKMGFVTTRGFRDLLEIARGNCPDLYNFCFSKPKPFVQRNLRKEVVVPSGEIDEEGLGEATRRFHEAYEREYAFRLESAVEIVNNHLAAYGAVSKPEVAALLRTERSAGNAIRGRREVDFDAHGVHQADIYDRALLKPGAEFSGPTAEEPATTIVILPGHKVVVDDYGNLHIHPK
jgi:N-methylhydantoinase A/oxoprolinase/acetone carboxylase beta subunit